MQTRQVVALVIVVTIIALTLGTILGYSLSSGRTYTTTTTQTYTTTTSVLLGNSSTQTNNTVCVIGDTGGGVYLELISTSGQPLDNISILATPKANSCYGFPPFPQATQQETNGSGWISLEGLQANYYYNMELTFQNRQYNFTLPQGPGEITMAKYSLPAGNLSINLCFNQPKSCYPYTGGSYQPTLTISTSVSTP